MTTQTEVRESFWETFPDYVTEHHRPIPYTQNGKRLYRRKTQNDYNATIRSLFVEYVDTLARNGEISETLASRVTL